MLSNRKGRKGKPAFAALAAATLAVGLFAGAGAAQAEPITIGDGTPCTFNGTSYPEGSEITDARGWKFICIAGEWVQIFDAVAVVDSGPNRPGAGSVGVTSIVSGFNGFDR